jgi:hypothetical protein
LNANTGALSWAFQTGKPVFASPSVVNNTVYICSDDGTVYSLRTSDGSKIWQAYIGSGTDHADDSPAVANGMVYIGSRNGYYALNTTNGAQIWFFTSPYSQRQLTGYVYSSPAVAGNVVYFGSCDNYVFALNAFDGSMTWSYHTGGFLFSSPAVVNGIVYIGSYDGYVYALGTPSATPTPTPTSNPTTTPSQLPNSTATPTPSPTIQLTTNSTPAPESTQAPALISIIQPTTIPALGVESNGDEPVNWLILGGIIAAAMVALILLYGVFKRTD